MFSSFRFVLARAVGVGALLLMLVSMLAPSTWAQSTPPLPTIQQVLDGVRANIATTIATLPNIECQEQAHSVALHNGKTKRDVILNSTLQARRMNDKTEDFAEERTPEPGGSVNGKPTKPGKKYGLPFLVTNGFGTTYEWALSPKAASCQTYKLVTGTAEESHWIGLQMTPKGADSAHCGTPPAGKIVTFWLDPASYQIRRFDEIDPHAILPLLIVHVAKIGIIDNAPYYVVGSTDYHLVSLGPKQYLLPEKVHAAAWAKEQNSPNELTYDAQYSNCHKFDSTVKIIDSSVPMTPSPAAPAQ